MCLAPVRHLGYISIRHIGCTSVAPLGHTEVSFQLCHLDKCKHTNKWNVPYMGDWTWIWVLALVQCMSHALARLHLICMSPWTFQIQQKAPLCCLSVFRAPDSLLCIVLVQCYDHGLPVTSYGLTLLTEWLLYRNTPDFAPGAPLCLFLTIFQFPYRFRRALSPYMVQEMLTTDGSTSEVLQTHIQHKGHSRLISSTSTAL
jgi:hypothetical protein